MRKIQNNEGLLYVISLLESRLYQSELNLDEASFGRICLQIVFVVLHGFVSAVENV